MNETVKVYWICTNKTDEKSERGTEDFQVTENSTYEDVEILLLNKADNSAINPNLASFKTERPDGSGHIRVYEKNKNGTWICVFKDNLVPTWFPIVMLGVLFGIPCVALCVVGIIKLFS